METMLKPPAHTTNATQKSTAITTNLYELIEAVQGQVGPEKDELVVATVMHILRTRRATFLHNTGASPCN